MEYTVDKLAKLAGISTRTLRYYDEIRLLTPVRSEFNRYRIYSDTQVDALQEILLFRELGMCLVQIRAMLQDPSHDRGKVLHTHLDELQKRADQISRLMDNVRKTIQTMEGEATMTDNEKFEGFKQTLVEKNEKKYGAETRKKYGDAKVDASNQKVKGMTPEQYEHVQKLSEELNRTLEAAFKTGDPAGEYSRKACALHKEWLCCFWPDGACSPEAHQALAKSYVDDARFTAYYDKIAPGCAVFLHDAIKEFYREK